MTEKEIAAKAAEIGLDSVGIVPIEVLSGYAERLEERIARIPDGERIFGWARRLAKAGEFYPWARSIVVAVAGMTHYKIPEGLTGFYGRHYLFDLRHNPEAREHKMIDELVEYCSADMKIEYLEHPGLVPVRHAAQAAGLGIIRKNNFFYTKKRGSFVRIAAWLTDRDMELIGDDPQAPCPDDCTKCRGACPTHSLSDAFTMNMATCVSKITANNTDERYDEDIMREVGSWIYGCDDCQTACPFNAPILKEWAYASEDFPGLEGLAPLLKPEVLKNLSDEEITEKVMPKFFYIDPEHLWRWRLNAENSIKNRQA